MKIERLFSVLSMAGLAALVSASAAYGAGADTGAAVPLPGSLVLVTTGVAALAGVSWWLRRK